MECLKPLFLPKRDMYVPCGRCAFCCATRRSDWSTRLRVEGRLHYGSKFVTLTYNPNHLTFLHGSAQLVKADLQRFFKRLRKAGYFCKYFAVGEYGSKTYRPHYHIILYGDVPEVAIRKAWSDFDHRSKKHYEIGHVHVGQVTPASVAYCLGYVVNGKSWKMRNRRVAPFSVMSKGLGANYLSSDVVAWHKAGRKNYVVLDGQKLHLPRYYKEKIFSKLDRLRIAHAAEKECFKRMLGFIRSKRGMRMRDPLGYLEQQRKVAAKSIKFKSKQNLVL